MRNLGTVAKRKKENKGFESSREGTDKSILKEGHVSQDKVAMCLKGIVTISTLKMRISKEDILSSLSKEFVLVGREDMSKTSVAKSLQGRQKRGW